MKEMYGISQDEVEDLKELHRDMCKWVDQMRDKYTTPQIASILLVTSASLRAATIPVEIWPIEEEIMNQVIAVFWREAKRARKEIDPSTS